MLAILKLYNRPADEAIKILRNKIFLCEILLIWYTTLSVGILKCPHFQYEQQRRQQQRSKGGYHSVQLHDARDGFGENDEVLEMSTLNVDAANSNAMAAKSGGPVKKQDVNEQVRLAVIKWLNDFGYPFHVSTFSNQRNETIIIVRLKCYRKFILPLLLVLIVLIGLAIAYA